MIVGCGIYCMVETIMLNSERSIADKEISVLWV